MNSALASAEAVRKHVNTQLLAHVEALLPLTVEALEEENQRLELYFKHIKNLEDSFKSILENLDLPPYD